MVEEAGWFVIIKFDCVSTSTLFFATVYMRLVYAALKDEEFSAFLVVPNHLDDNYMHLTFSCMGMVFFQRFACFI